MFHILNVQNLPQKIAKDFSCNYGVFRRAPFLTNCMPKSEATECPIDKRLKDVLLVIHLVHYMKKALNKPTSHCCVQ